MSRRFKLSNFYPRRNRLRVAARHGLILRLGFPYPATNRATTRRTLSARQKKGRSGEHPVLRHERQGLVCGYDRKFCDEFGIAVGDEVDHEAFAAGASGTADTVEVGFHLFRHVVVDDAFDVFDVEAA